MDTLESDQRYLHLNYFRERLLRLVIAPYLLPSLALRYPLAYSIVVLPLSIVRWMTFSAAAHDCGRSKISAAATLAAASLHGCFGFVNVLLLLKTRQALLLFDDPRQPQQLRLRRSAGTVLRDLDNAEREQT